MDIIIGLIYRVPDSNTIFFNQEQSDILQKYTKENKSIYVMDDYNNIDILNVPKMSISK